MVAYDRGRFPYARAGADPGSWQGTVLVDKADAAGTYYRRNRVYDPATGRFTQEDPTGLAGGLNLYGFAAGDPVNLSDPFGLRAGCDPPDSPKCTDVPIEKVTADIKVANAFLLLSGVGDLFEAGLAIVEDAIAPAAIETAYGTAVQEGSAAAQTLRAEVSSGQQIFRGGNLGQSTAAEGQFWAAESPLNPGFANRLGAGSFSGSPEFIIGGTMRPGAAFITRTAPGLGQNVGGALEIVTNPWSVRLDFFSMP